MYKPSTYLVITYFPTYLPMYETYFLQNLVAKVKPNINSLEVHPQLSNNGHTVGGMVHWWVLVDCGSVLRKVAQPLVMCLSLGTTSCYIGLHNKLVVYATCLVTISP
jgi:hypothetical protein